MKHFTCVVLIIFLLFAFVIPSFANEVNKFAVNALVQGGSESRITISGKNVTDLYAYEAVISFDSDALEVRGVTSGLKGFSVSPRVEGNKLIVAFTKVGEVPGEKGNITLNTITFRSKKTGISQVKLESITVVDSTLSASTYYPNSAVTVTHKGSVYKQDTTSSSDGRKVTGTLSDYNFEDMFSKAEADERGIKTVEVEISGSTAANVYILRIPAALLADEVTTKYIIIRTPIGRISIPNNIMKKEWIDGVKYVSIVIQKIDPDTLEQPIREKIRSRPAIKLGILLDDKEFQWSKPDSFVQVIMPYHPTEQEAVSHEHLVVWYIDNELNVIPVPTGRFNPELQEISFVTNHFSMYAVTFVEKTFDDIQNHWCQKYVEVMASKGIIKGYTDRFFGVHDNISRADYLTLHIRALGISAEVDDNFADVETDKYYYETLGTAKKLGLVNIKDDLFRPDEPITREDMMVFTASVLNFSNGYIHHGTIEDLNQYTDVDSISPEAVESVAILVKEGIIEGNNNELFPKNYLTRAEAATVLYRMYNKLWGNLDN